MTKTTIQSALEPKQEKFCQEYALSLNATQSYLKAYPDSKYRSARSSSCDLLANPDIQSRIAVIQNGFQKKKEYSLDDFIAEVNWMMDKAKELEDMNAYSKGLLLKKDVFGFDKEKTDKIVLIQINNPLPLPQGTAPQLEVLKRVS